MHFAYPSWLLEAEHKGRSRAAWEHKGLQDPLTPLTLETPGGDFVTLSEKETPAGDFFFESSTSQVVVFFFSVP